MIANSCRTQARKCVVPSGSAAHARGAMAAAKRPRKKGDMNLRRAVGVQPGSTRTARLIPEYKLVMALKITDEEYKVIKEAKTKNKGWVKEPIVLLAGHIPAGTRILRRKGDDQQGSSPGRDEGSGEVQYGTPWPGAGPPCMGGFSRRQAKSGKSGGCPPHARRRAGTQAWTSQKW